MCCGASPAQLIPPGPRTSTRTITGHPVLPGLATLQGLFPHPQESLSITYSPHYWVLVSPPPLASIFLGVLTRSQALGPPLPSCQGGWVGWPLSSMRLLSPLSHSSQSQGSFYMGSADCLTKWSCRLFSLVCGFMCPCHYTPVPGSMPREGVGRP